MIITIDNLKAGLKWWRNGNWPKDIHNEDYYTIYGARSAGPTDEWWKATVDRLSQWRAYRGPTPPNTKADIAERGARVLCGIAHQVAKLIASAAGEPSIAVLSWEDVAPVFLLASQIKSAPVFAGKMCHFLFPRLFIVMDNLATNVFDYEFYWRGMKAEWDRFDAKADARNLIADAIKSEHPIHPLYPFETKIMELSHIGYKHR